MCLSEKRQLKDRSMQTATFTLIATLGICAKSLAADVGSPADPVVAAVCQRVPANDITWLRHATEKQLQGCRIRATNGQWLFTPDGVGSYRALWTRDFAYMVEYDSEALPNASTAIITTSATMW